MPGKLVGRVVRPAAIFSRVRYPNGDHVVILLERTSTPAIKISRWRYAGLRREEVAILNPGRAAAAWKLDLTGGVSEIGARILDRTTEIALSCDSAEGVRRAFKEANLGYPEGAAASPDGGRSSDR